MSHLVSEILLRLAKAGAAALLGLAVFALAVALGEPATITLALLCCLAGAAFVLLIETSPI
jgi:nitrate/nitrite transporter NarK